MRNLAMALLLACATTPSRTVVVVTDEKPAAAVAVSADDAPCANDADCALTRVGAEETACCPMLCTPRVVTKKRARELDDRISTCASGRECPQPMCRAPREQVMAVCAQNKCVGKPVSPPADK